MSLVNWLCNLLPRTRRHDGRRPRSPCHRYAPWMESLEDRLAPAVTTSFSLGVLSLTYGAAGDNVTVLHQTSGGPSDFVVVGIGGTVIVGPTTATSVAALTATGTSAPGQILT